MRLAGPAAGSARPAFLASSGFCFSSVRMAEIAFWMTEAAEGGPIAALRNGDTIVIDIKKRKLNVELSAAEIKKRLKSAKRPKPRYTWGVLAKYARLVSSASDGAVTG